jgi:hypothetical protein
MLAEPSGHQDRHIHKRIGLADTALPSRVVTDHLRLAVFLCGGSSVAQIAIAISYQEEVRRIPLISARVSVG